MVSLQKSDSVNKYDPLIAIENVTKSYGRKKVLSIDNLVVEKNSSICILGSNGSGKSTLLRLLAGVSVPSTGRLMFSKEVGNCVSTYLPQSKGIIPEFTVRHFLSLYLKLYDIRGEQDFSQMEYLIKFDLIPYLDKKMSTLSGGYQKLVSLACIFSVKPDIIFLDEPLGSLDMDFRASISKEIADISNSKTLTVVTMHSKTEFDDLDCYLEMKEGELSVIK